MLAREIANGFGEAADRVARSIGEEIQDEGIVTEDDISSQLCALLKFAFNDYDSRFEVPGVSRMRFRARHLTSTGSGAEERRTGADIIFVLDIELPDQIVTKGFLAQAKRIQPGEILSSAEWDRLQEQCKRMMARTPASYVFTYSPEGVRPLSASAVASVPARGLWGIEQYSFGVLFQDFLLSWVGDRRIMGTRRANVRALLRDLDADHILTFQISGPEVPDKYGPADEEE